MYKYMFMLVPMQFVDAHVLTHERSIQKRGETPHARLIQSKINETEWYIKPGAKTIRNMCGWKTTDLCGTYNLVFFRNALVVCCFLVFFFCFRFVCNDFL